MTKKYILSLVLLCAATHVALAQELKAIVTVNAPQLTIIDPQVIEEFENNVRDFLNNTRFTEEEYEDTERIECNFTFTLTAEKSETLLQMDLLVQSSRPVYSSDYQSTLLNYLDKSAQIPYEQYQPLEFNRDNYTSTLVSFLNFYAYIIIAMDKDSFIPMAGEEYYRAAENVVTVLPPAIANSDKSWGNNGGQRSRFRLIQELLNPRARPYRQMLYDYHRQGLDVMSGDPVAGRAVMGVALEQLRDVRSDVPNSILLANFASSKTQEVVDVFVAAPVPERKSAYQVMTTIDPANVNRYRSLR